MGKQTDFDIVVIDGGIVGLASAYKIQMHYQDIRIGVFEKEKQLAMHQTGRNSGVIHSGLYYKSGSYKAKNCVKGRKELIDFAAEHNIPYEICGKIIVATDEAELNTLEEVFQNGLENQIEGIEKIGPEQINEIEPFCQGIAGIYVPCTGIIDFREVAKKLAELLESKSQESSVLTCCDSVSGYWRNGKSNCRRTFQSLTRPLRLGNVLAGRNRTVGVSSFWIMSERRNST